MTRTAAKTQMDAVQFDNRLGGIAAVAAFFEHLVFPLYGKSGRDRNLQSKIQFYIAILVGALRNAFTCRPSVVVWATIICVLTGPATAGAETGLRIVVYGDSLTAGLGLDASAAYPAQLETALRQRGHDITIVNAGVSGDTTSAGLARFDWTMAEPADGIILELGANDALRGVDPVVTREALDTLLGRIKERHIPVLLMGMIAPLNLGPEYARKFNPIFKELAVKHDVLLYDFFLDGVAVQPELNQSDGMHPNAAGVAEIVRRTLPKVLKLVAQIQAVERRAAN